MDLQTLETRARDLGTDCAEYFLAWPRTYDLTKLVNREWQPEHLSYLMEGVDADHRDMVLHDYSGQLFAIAVVAAHDSSEECQSQADEEAC